MAQPIEPSDASALTAIIVDDSPLFRAMTRDMLHAAGIRVVAEGISGCEALALYEQHRASLVVMDVVMPHMDGVAAASELLRRFPEAQVVMCSSLAARERIIQCRDAGVRHFLLKPFRPEKFLGVVQSVTAGRMAMGEASVH